MPPITIAIPKGKDLIAQLSLIDKQLRIIDEFRIMGVNDNIQNLPDTLVATPNKATADIKGIKIIVILVSVVI